MTELSKTRINPEFLLLERLEEEETQEFGLIDPTANQDGVGRIVLLGYEAQTKEGFDFEIGAKVWFNAARGVKKRIDGKNYVFIHYANIDLVERKK